MTKKITGITIRPILRNSIDEGDFQDSNINTTVERLNPFEWAKDNGKWTEINKYWEEVLRKLNCLKEYVLFLLKDSCNNFRDDENFERSYNFSTTTNISRTYGYQYSKDYKFREFICRYQVYYPINQVITVSRKCKANYYRKYKIWGYDSEKLSKDERLELINKHTDLLYYIAYNIGHFETGRDLFAMDVDMIRGNTEHWSVSDSITKVECLPMETQFKITLDRVSKNGRLLSEIVHFENYVIEVLKNSNADIQKHGLRKKVAEYIADELYKRGLDRDVTTIQKRLSELIKRKK